ncbi:Trk system potassium transporter TrkA [Conexibacter sp. CPCC 206217]|uniref:Trk system potassium transporter TrkA n=1 Tax=Conexibacter sp. CPCC 206217 TaxID=3064574 RepID=UPI002722A2B5|nr:Trk system potassium transporter TrkA [Conexibacter sp. CPCC 206217]MDO8210464.1 Trk system potassium transporter TrkA [Conexibacter sp. CPCC 206217]
MRIIVLGAGHVGLTVVDALYEDHELTVVDRDPGRLAALTNAFDVRTVEGNGASRRVLEEAGVRGADLLISSTAKDEVNLVAAMLVRRLSQTTRTLVRTTDVEHLAAWQEGVLEVDFMVSSELEAASAVIDAIAVPGARVADLFADGQVVVAEFDVEQRAHACALLNVPLSQAPLPPDSRVALIVRGRELLLPRGDAQMRIGDRVVVMASREAALEWSRQLAPHEPQVEDVIVLGATPVGLAIARKLLVHRYRVRIFEPDAELARHAAAELPDARVFHASVSDHELLREERVGSAQVAVAALGDDAQSLYAALTAGVSGVHTTIGVVDDPLSAAVFERAGVDVAINPRTATAQELIRFAHDPRTRQIALLDDDRFDVLDIVVRPESELIGRPLRELPRTGSTIGAIVRDGSVLFTHGDSELRAGDRVIVLIDQARATQVEAAL